MGGGTLVIYGDIFMLINAACDYTVLFLTAVLLRRRVLKRRLLLGAVIGGLYALLYLYISQKILLSAVLSLLCCLWMVVTVFSFGSIRHFLRAAACFFLTALLMGGTVSAVSRFLAIYLTTPFRNFALLTLTMLPASAAALFGGKLLQKRCAGRIVHIDFILQSQGHSCTVLVDSGNLLTDGETGLPVIILSPEVFGENRPVCQRVLPVQTVSSQTTLPCFLPECLKIEKKERNALLAIAHENMNFGNTQGLLPECLLF